MTRPAIVVGLVAAVLTCTGSLWGHSALASTFGDVFLSWGIIAASIPFGGLHNDPPVFLVFAVGAFLNALLWGGITAGVASLLRQVRLRRKDWRA